MLSIRTGYKRLLGKVRKFVISAHKLIHPPSQCGCCVQQDSLEKIQSQLESFYVHVLLDGNIEISSEKYSEAKSSNSHSLFSSHKPPFMDNNQWKFFPKVDMNSLLDMTYQGGLPRWYTTSLSMELLMPRWKFVWESCNWMSENGNGGNGIRNTIVDTLHGVILFKSSMLILSEILII